MKRRARPDALAAYLAAGFNLLAGLVMLAVLRPGVPTPGATFDARLAFIHANVGIWWAGWVVWQASALTLVGFYVALALRWRANAPIRCGLALVAAAAGLAADLSAETLYMGALPFADRAGAALVDVIAESLTGYLGNGLYTVAGVMLVTAGARELPRWLVALSVPVWIAGFVLSAATIGHNATAEFGATAALMPLFVLWTFLIGRWLDRPGS